MDQPDISLIIPTLNEAENLPPLLARIAAALNGRAYEVIVVDDNSRDNTKEVSASLATQYPLKLIVREQPKDGLGGAVLHGMRLSRGKYLVVMDADLQHPPEKLPELLAPLENQNGTDFVVGSRHVPGASTGERWGVMRKINSDVATLLARPFAGATRDPMSGFFAMRRDTFEGAQRLTPLGYKIGLELMCKCRVNHVKEVPIHFAERTRGESKLSLREQFRYLEHLSRLYDFCFPRLSPIAKFLIVLIISMLVSFGVFELLLYNGGGPRWSPILAYPGAIVVTAVFHRRYIRTQREFIRSPRPWFDFFFVAAMEWAVCAITSLWLSARAQEASAVEIFIICFGMATIARYVLRKELMQDVRGLRRQDRVGDIS
ncbi:MAG: glycosyltransferase family 2 protein [Anaerolineae bacterium]|nr:glycosyltransferase family 2 protein [Phycisphaerae bacterium]